MKRTSLLLLLVALASVSCRKDPEPVNEIKYGIDGKTPLPEAIDLGITVNGKTVRWASFNLGASDEYGFGDFYAWGETEIKTVYDWETYAFGHYSNWGPKLTRYCLKENKDYWDYDAVPEGPDNQGVLLSTDDAAQIKLGKNWHIPSDEDWTALFKTKSDKDHYSWTREKAKDAQGAPLLDAEGQDVWGWRIVSKNPGTEGNSIFLPAAGEFSGEQRREGVVGYYWSSGLYHDVYANAFYFSGDLVSSSLNYSATRCIGFSIRPVCY